MNHLLLVILDAAIGESVHHLANLPTLITSGLEWRKFLAFFIHQIQPHFRMPPSLIEDFVKGFEDLDWDLAIRRNRDQLRQIVLALFALARMRVGGSLFTLPRSTFALIMLVLRPAESAVRRLIVIVAQGLKPMVLVSSRADFGRLANLPPCGGRGSVSRNAKAIDPVNRLQTTSARSHATGWAEGDRGGYKSFPLFDPLKSFDPDSIWDTEPAFISSYSLTKSIPWYDASSDSTPIDATHLGLRLNAILRALNDLPRQARRLKRWELKRDELLKSLTLRCDPDSGTPRRAKPWRPVRFSPMRPGLPPGWRERRIHDIDDVLKECHRLANDRLNDTL